MEYMYCGKCDVKHTVEVELDDGSTGYQWETVISDVPCRISFSSKPNANKGDAVDTVSQSITLFCAPDVPLKEGCRVKATQDGATREYDCAGIPVVRETHQSVSLVYSDEC